LLLNAECNLLLALSGLENLLREPGVLAEALHLAPDVLLELATEDGLSNVGGKATHHALALNPLCALLGLNHGGLAGLSKRGKVKRTHRPQRFDFALSRTGFFGGTRTELCGLIPRKFSLPRSHLFGVL
jgi:hypothetical protein